MSDLLGIAAGVLMVYFGVGAVTLAVYDKISERGVADRDEAAQIVSCWPIILFVAFVGTAIMGAAHHDR